MVNRQPVRERGRREVLLNRISLISSRFRFKVYSRLLSEIMFISRETELNGSRGDFVIGIMRGWRRACLEIHDESYVAFSLITHGPLNQLRTLTDIE